MTVGIRELKNNLSHYVREVERGRRVSVTSNGRIVAELVPPASHRESRQRAVSRHQQLVVEGVIRPALEAGDPFEGEDTKPVMQPGEALAILDWLRGES